MLNCSNVVGSGLLRQRAFPSCSEDEAVQEWEHGRLKATVERYRRLFADAHPPLSFQPGVAVVVVARAVEGILADGGGHHAVDGVGQGQLGGHLDVVEGRLTAHGAVAAALHNPASYHVNPFRRVAGYLGAALRRGGRVQYGVEVKEIKVGNGRIDRVVTDQGDYYADWVVVAGGAHTPQILSSLDLQIPIVPARGQVILTEACQRMTEHVIMFLDHLYIRQTASGNFYLGSHTEFVGFENRITLEKITAFTQAFTRAVPLLARLRALRFFAGFRPICEDNLPIIGPVPACSRLIVASGHGRTGVRFSASTGKAVSELIVDGKTEHPIDAFGVARFVKHAETR